MATVCNIDQGTTRSPLKAIRWKCLDCSCGAWSEVEKCVVPDCPLWPFRFGKRPDTAAKKGKLVMADDEE